MTKLVFLDIDGVLDTYKSRYQLDPELMAHLGTLLEKTGASIVISSSGSGMTSGLKLHFE